jgi:acetylornithine deacetylase/succinyl-diaminopimelate desuccinylase-like protein
MADETADHRYAAFDTLVAERLDGWVEELRDFCSIGSEAADPDALRRAAAWTADRLRAAGADVKTLELDGVPPLVVGEAGAGDRTLICVQHYDVQPAVPLELWTTPPYEPDVRDRRLFARGAADNKGEFLLRVWALEAYRATIGELPCRVRFLVEGEEESGSPNLDALLDLGDDLRRGDAALIEGGEVDRDGHPLVDTGVRGILVVRLTARTLSSDAHSSVAMLLPNAAVRLVQALATLWDERGLPRFAGWNGDARGPTLAEQELIAGLPDSLLDEIRAAYGVERFLAGRDGAEAFEAATFEPTCNIQGIWAGYTGPGTKTVTPAEANARVDIRLVPHQDPDRMLAALRAHLDASGFGDVEVTSEEDAERPYWSPIDHPLVDAAVRASESAFGVSAIRLPPAPGTAPMYQVCARHELPMVSMGAVDHLAYAHAPDESESIELMGKAARVMGRFLDEFAALER